MPHVTPTPDATIDALVVMARRTCPSGTAQEQIRAFVRLLEAEIEARLQRDAPLTRRGVRATNRRVPNFG